MLRDLFSLFPAYAGVILRRAKFQRDFNPFPRIRGGDPAVCVSGSRTRLLFPAYAGVILCQWRRSLKLGAFPRIRGGDPCCVVISVVPEIFSPHTRG